MSEHVHTPDDGRPWNREVFLDGVKLTGCVYADTLNGVVRCYFNPVRINKRRDVVRTFKRRGQVEVRSP